MTRSEPEVVELDVAEAPDAWAGAGFTIDDDATCRIGGVRVRLVGPGPRAGVVAWSLRHLPDDAAADLDGLATRRDDRPAAAPADHPNGVCRIDHMVLLTDGLDRTAGAAATIGLIERRRRDHHLPGRDPMVQAFYRVGEVILEVVGPAQVPADPRDGVTSFGLALVADDLAASAAALGDHLSPARPAVQPGRQIATVRHRDLGLRTPLALMTSRPPRAPTGPG